MSAKSDGHRQIRITPLPGRVYFQAKLLCGYLMAILTHRPALRAGATSA